MSLPNQVVYIQFHPIAYMVKLNIEMSMADLIVKTARSSEIDVNPKSSSMTTYPDTRSQHTRNHLGTGHDYVGGQTSTVQAGHEPSAELEDGRRHELKGITRTRQTEVQVYTHDSDSDSLGSATKDKPSLERDASKNRLGRTQSRHSDGSQIPLKDLDPHVTYPH